MTEQELYDNGVTSSGRAYCPIHGWIAFLNSAGDIRCPHCGWVNHVPYRYNSQWNGVEYLDDDDD